MLIYVLVGEIPNFSLNGLIDQFLSLVSAVKTTRGVCFLSLTGPAARRTCCMCSLDTSNKSIEANIGKEMIRKFLPLICCRIFFDKGCSYLKMMFIYGFVHLAPTSFISGSSSSDCLATSAHLTVTVLSLSCFKACVKKVLDFRCLVKVHVRAKRTVQESLESLDTAVKILKSFIILHICLKHFQFGSCVVTSILWMSSRSASRPSTCLSHNTRSQ